MPRTLAQNATYINETIKPAIKAAIEAQGVTVPSTDSFLDYADRISEIEGGGSGYQLKDLPTGAISTVNDAAPLPLNALKVSIEAVQSGSGDPSPSNIRPIHGWDSGEINIESKNAINLTFSNDTDSVAGLTFTHTASSFSLSGTAAGGYKIFNISDLPKLKIGATYTFSVRTTGTKARCLVSINLYKNTGSTTVTSKSLRVNIDDDNLLYTDFVVNEVYTRATFVIEGVQANTVFDCNVDVQIEAGSSPTAFTPYVNGTTTTLNFPQTIYGAEWDVINGELGLKITDGFYSSYNGETLPGIWMSDRDVYQAGTTPTIGAGVKYKLATPTYITLTGLSIRLLEGTNNIYADCGEVLEGEYFIDEGAIDVRKVDYQIGASGSIKTTDGRVLSGFASMSGYHARPLDASGNWLDVDWSKDFEIGVAFKFTAFPTYQGITGDGNYNSWRKAPRMDYDNSEGKIDLCVSSDGSTLAIDAYLDYSLVINKWYFIKLKFVQSTMTLTVDITEDFSTFTSLYNNTMASAPYHDAASLCFGGDAQQSNMASNTFLIDTFNTYIKGDGADWGAFTGVFPS